VVARPAKEVGRPSGFDAIIVGGALDANGWHRAARRFVSRNTRPSRRPGKSRASRSASARSATRPSAGDFAGARGTLAGLPSAPYPLRLFLDLRDPWRQRVLDGYRRVRWATAQASTARGDHAPS